MSMTATASTGMTGRDEGSSPLILSPRALRLPVAVSLLLHASVFAGILFWWQSSGTPAPNGLPDGVAVTFVSLSEPAPAAPARVAMPVAVSQPEPKPEPVVERLPESAPAPAPAVTLPEPVASPPLTVPLRNRSRPPPSRRPMRATAPARAPRSASRKRTATRPMMSSSASRGIAARRCPIHAARATSGRKARPGFV